MALFASLQTPKPNATSIRWLIIVYIALHALLLVAPANAQLGHAIPFDGIDDYIEVDAQYAWEDGLSFEARFKVETLRDERQNVVRIGDPQPFYGLAIRADGGIDFTVYAEHWVYRTVSGDDSNWQALDPQVIVIKTAAGAISPGRWHHLAATCSLSDDLDDQGSRRAALYIDGQPVATLVHRPYRTPSPVDVFLNGTSTYTRFATVDQPLTIGQGFNGELDEVRLWNMERTREQIVETIDDALVGYEDGLVGLWHLDDRSQTVIDATGNKDGTLYNCDITPPTLELVGADEISVEAFTDEVIEEYFDNGAVAEDNLDADVAIVYESDIDTVHPLPARYRFTYRATDDAGNYAEVQRTVHFTGPQLESGYIALQACEGNWVSSADDAHLTANRDEIGATEIFYLKNLGTNYYALRAHDGRWVSVDKDGNIAATTTTIGATEQFQLVAVEDGTFALHAANARFLSAELDRGGRLQGNRTQIAEWECFAIERVALSGAIGLQSSAGHWVSADPGDNFELIANRDNLLPWETFHLEKMDDVSEMDASRSGAVHHYALRAHNGQWVGREADGRLLGNRASADEAESLALVPQGEGTFALQTSDGRFVAAELDERGELRGDRWEIGAWEVFTILPLSVE